MAGNLGPARHVTRCRRLSGDSIHYRKALLLEMRIEGEGFGEITLAHRDERYGIYNAQETLSAIEQQIQSRVV